jgi:hypothetical protein
VRASAPQYTSRQTVQPQHVAATEPETAPTSEPELDLPVFDLDQRVPVGALADGAGATHREDPHVPFERRREGAGDQWAGIVTAPRAGHSVGGSPNVENTDASNVVMSTTRSRSIRSTSRVTPRNVDSPQRRR